LLTHNGAQRLLDTLLDTCKKRGWIKTRGKHRTDSTSVVAAIRRLYYLECVQEAMHYALNQLNEAAPQWVRGWAPREWYERYGPRAALFRLPKETSKRDALALGIGVDGYELLDALCHEASARHLLALPAVAILRQIWMQHSYRCTEPGFEDIHWRETADQPPSSQLMQSPYDIEARYSSKHSTHWVGYKAHLTATCDAGYPDLITQVSTTLATTSDFVMGAPIAQDLAARDLLPGTHLLDSGYVVADLLVSAPRDHHIDVVGPALSSSSPPGRAGQGYDVHAFAIAWEAQQAHCPQGHRRVKWTPGHSQEGHAVIRIRFDKATCDACAERPACTSSTKYPRQLTVKPQALHEAIAAAHARQATTECKEQYALRAGVESTISQGARRFELRRRRYTGLARTHLPQTINATAMHLVRLAAWLRKGGVEQPKRRPGHFARLAPPPLFGLAACGAGTT
jgi:transposase